MVCLEDVSWHTEWEQVRLTYSHDACRALKAGAVMLGLMVSVQKQDGGKWDER